MKKTAILLSILIFNGCSTMDIFTPATIDKVQLVGSANGVRTYRAYFARNSLLPIKTNQKYLFFYSSKKSDMAILIHRLNRYELHSIFHPSSRKNIKTIKYKSAISRLSKMGYRRTSPSAHKCKIITGNRIYKGFETLMIEIKRDLRGNIKKTYKSVTHAKKIPARKTLYQKPVSITPPIVRIKKVTQVKVSSIHLLENGSIEELIEAYKTNKDPRYKAKILLLMKESRQ